MGGASWARPADMMKMKNTHVITLSSAATTFLNYIAPEGERRGLILPSLNGTSLSDMSLTKIMRLADLSETVHGFHSAFRDWAAKQMPIVPAMVAEIALARRVGTATEQAYLRTHLRDMRRNFMEAWGRFVSPSLSGNAENVLHMSANRRPVSL